VSIVNGGEEDVGSLRGVERNCASDLAEGREASEGRGGGEDQVRRIQNCNGGEKRLSGEGKGNPSVDQGI